MGKGDAYVKKMLKHPDNFADLYNVKVFGGRRVIRPEDLTPVPEETEIILADKKRKQALQRRRDVVMKTSFGVYLTVLACEAQENIHYAMPVRTILYDALGYTEQIQRLEQGHRDKKELLESGEFLSGIKKEDRICPIVTLVFYYGRKEWDGSRSLYEMMGLSEDDEVARELLNYVQDYRINLVDAANETDLEKYESDLQYVLGMLKCNKNKRELYQYTRDNRENLNAMSVDAISAMLVMLGEQERVMRILEADEERGEVDMCQAIDELIADGREEGRIEGEARGEARIVAMIRKKAAKGLGAAAAADELELSREYVEQVVALMSEDADRTDLQVAELLIRQE